jgi:ribonucleoside-diphosphate reductase beta chain
VGLFDRRVTYKPFEYPFTVGYKEAIQNTPWLVKKWGNFEPDYHQYVTQLSPHQRQVVKRAILAISQVEVGVKKFWGRLGDRFPKPEFEAVGAVYAESEERHASAYSRLLDVLGLNAEFEDVVNQSAIGGRVAYLSEVMASWPTLGNRDYTKTLALFSLLIENVSLFTQFLIIKSFNKHLGLLKDIDNVIQETASEEALHALFGSALVNLIRQENPDWFDADFERSIRRMCCRAIAVENQIVDWIYGGEELAHMPSRVVKEFAMKRANDSLALIGYAPEFVVNDALYSEVLWFDEEMNAVISTDFFHKSSPNYSVLTKSYTAEDLFE